MSFWVYLTDKKGNTLKVESHQEGGTYVQGGCNEAELNITYNYSKFYYEHIDKEEGLRWLNGKKASQTLTRLANAIKKLGTKRDDDYWKPTPGNAGYALSILVIWGVGHPEGTWNVD